MGLIEFTAPQKVQDGFLVQPALFQFEFHLQLGGTMGDIACTKHLISLSRTGCRDDSELQYTARVAGRRVDAPNSAWLQVALATSTSRATKSCCRKGSPQRQRGNKTQALHTRCLLLIWFVS